MAFQNKAERDIFSDLSFLPIILKTWFLIKTETVSLCMSQKTRFSFVEHPNCVIHSCQSSTGKRKVNIG